MGNRVLLKRLLCLFLGHQPMFSARSGMLLLTCARCGEGCMSGGSLVWTNPPRTPLWFWSKE